MHSGVLRSLRALLLSWLAGSFLVGLTVRLIF